MSFCHGCKDTLARQGARFAVLTFEWTGPIQLPYCLFLEISIIPLLC